MRRYWKILRSDRASLCGAILVLAFVLVALLAPKLLSNPEAALQADVMQRLRPPSSEFWFGTDNLGRDLFGRILLGARASLGLACGVMGLSMLIGVPLGLLAGYFRGWWAEGLMRLTDMFLAVPQMIMALALAQLLKPSSTTIFIALSVTYWPFFTRTVCAETQRLRSVVFVDALESLNTSVLRIVVMHILPNIAAAIIVRATLGTGFVILAASVLGFLGLGAPPPAPDWGQAIADSRQYLPDAWWYALFPGIAMFLAVFGFNLLGDGMRDLLDPKMVGSK